MAHRWRRKAVVRGERSVAESIYTFDHPPPDTMPFLSCHVARGPRYSSFMSLRGHSWGPPRQALPKHATPFRQRRVVEPLCLPCAGAMMRLRLLQYGAFSHRLVTGRD